MWSIKETKQKAKAAMKKNYWVLIFVLAVSLYLEVIPGNGVELLSLSNTAVTGEAAAETSADYQLGVVRYLNSIVNGESKERQVAIAQEVMESFNGLGGNIYGIVRGIDRFIFTNDTAAKIIIVICTIIYLIFAYLIRNQLYVGLMRMSIDGYKPDHKLHFSDYFVIFRTGGYLNVAWVMILWQACLDVIGLAGVAVAIAGGTLIANGTSMLAGVLLILLALGLAALYIRRFLIWAMVPYILASNPKAKAKECFALSKAMMEGSKWQLLLLRLSFIGWDILSIPTIGLLDLFYIEPMVYMSGGSVYQQLREKALKENMEYSYLIEEDVLALSPKALKPNRLGELIADKNPMRKYSLVNIILMFFIFAFAGWCWEVLIHIVKDGVFVNRGTMHGPWLPIYGFGGAGIIYFLRRFAKKPWLLITTIFVGCGILEYVTHWYLELTKGIKWWDYSNYFLNLNGRICFEGLFVFCIAGVFAVYVAGPALDNLLNRISDKKKWTVAAILVAIFAADMAYSHKHPNVGKGITDYGKK